MPAEALPWLAHSAPEEGRGAQTYANHVAHVRRGAVERAEAMLRFATNQPTGLLHAIDIAAAFHDLGKLDDAIQNALRRGRNARLPWDHIDAGVKHVAAGQNWMAAWLIRAHHAPGLPCRTLHFDADGLGLKLRGRRHDEEDRERHDEQIERTNRYLATYLDRHEAELGSETIAAVKSSHGLTMRLALSSLVDADHSDAARFDAGQELPAPLHPRWNERLLSLNAYVDRLPQAGREERDHHRSAFYKQARDASFKEPMVACEGPVGLGKTTAVTAYLLRRAANERLRHVFVVAPYTNIISQAVQRLRDALVLPGEDPARVVVEHHHRADFDNIASRSLAVLRRAPIVVTTAVQFFETLAASTPAALRKLHELPGSAVFLDEAHAALPTHLWPQNWQWLRELSELWGCRFVFASGSLARFWENGEIVEQPMKLPELLSPELAPSVLAAERRRIRYQCLKPGRVETVRGLIGHIAPEPGPRLVILNTVQSAAAVAHTMRGEGHDVLHISTALSPDDRDCIFRRIRERLRIDANSDWTLVATSCVEAGVDLSFRTAFREQFSTANLIQVGGRVNRHGEYAGPCRVYDFAIDTGAGITAHPGARYSSEVLQALLSEGAFEDLDPAQLVTHSMARELKKRGGLGIDLLRKAEKARDYPAVASLGRVITAESGLIVVDRELRQRLLEREPVGFRDLLRGTVQIWATKISKLKLAPLNAGGDIYDWPYRYDQEFLGYMAGILSIDAFIQKGYEFY